MEARNTCTQHRSLNGSMACISCITENAPPNSAFEVSTHYEELEIYHFLEGDLSFSFEGQHIKVENGTMIIIANGVLHKPIIQSPCLYHRKRILFHKSIFIKTDTLDFELYNRINRRKILVLRKETLEKAGIDMLFREIEGYLALQSKYGDFCAMISLFSLLIKADENSEQIETVLLSTHNDNIARILEYINGHLQEELDYRVLSKIFNISEKSLYKFFKRETGFALGNYINERRIIMAQSLLHAGASAKTVAYAVGFQDYSSFYRCFLKKVGISPSDYIKANRQ